MTESGFLGWLTRTPVVLFFFAAFVLVGGGFYFVQQATGGVLLDTLMNGDDAIIRLAQMTPDQKQAHFRGTVLLDTLYPITYIGAIGGLSARLAGKWRIWVLLPIVFTAIADFIENTAQALALAGRPAEVLLIKDVVSPLKFGGLSFAVILMLLLIIVALARRYSNQRDTKK
jgi:hypothetical protein